ncbi:TetR/AcrR family transcriptional regulator [Streptomyces sp. NPDC058872]|uniref:TetR/AcrR family transcriptional regulator n=1 Tax=Streptomyces sp. NPDC058872 TaxID=3346661 RepID=UPI0036ADC05B
MPQTRARTPQLLRRAPVQRRSAERLTRILDACAVLLDESGYESLSTRAVAARAGVPIGSVYRFFGNKRAMVAALAHRNLDRYAERVSSRLSVAPLLDARGAIDGVLDEFIEMKRTVPGFVLVDFGLPAAATGTDEEADGLAGEDPNLLVAERICALLAAHLDRPADADLQRKVLVGVEAADALVRLAFRADPSGDPSLVAETRCLLHAYLAPSLS